MVIPEYVSIFFPRYKFFFGFWLFSKPKFVSISKIQYMYIKMKSSRMNYLKKIVKLKKTIG